MAGLWLAGEMVDHIGIYGSKVAEGLSAFHRRSCYILRPQAYPSYQIAQFMGPTWGPPGSCRPQMDPMMAPWSMLMNSTLCGIVWRKINMFFISYHSSTLKVHNEMAEVFEMLFHWRQGCFYLQIYLQYWPTTYKRYVQHRKLAICIII